MSYSSYYLGEKDKNGSDYIRGHAIDDVCNSEGCEKKIDRGLGCLCYSCTGYFCSEHLTEAYTEQDKPVEFQCFAGASTQICVGCEKEYLINK